jgi:hypothetical protein
MSLFMAGGGGTEEKCFSLENFADPTNKKSKIWLPNLKYQLKNKYPPLAKNFTKGNHSVVTHVLYHFCDMSLITDCEIFCSLKFHVVCTCTFFGDNICLPTNRKMVKIVTLIDSHIVLTYDCWHCFLSLQYFSESCFGNDNKFLLPNPWVVLFFIYPPFPYSKFCLPNPFLFGTTPRHK